MCYPPRNCQPLHSRLETCLWHALAPDVENGVLLLVLVIYIVLVGTRSRKLPALNGLMRDASEIYNSCPSSITSGSRCHPSEPTASAAVNKGENFSSVHSSAPVLNPAGIHRDSGPVASS